MIRGPTVFAAEFTDQGIDQLFLLKIELNEIKTGNMKLRNRVGAAPDASDLELQLGSALHFLGQ